MKYVLPAPDLAAFNCPYCRAFAHQEWYAGAAYRFAWPLTAFPAPTEPITPKKLNPPKIFETEIYNNSSRVGGLRLSRCANCQNATVWINDYIVFPQTNRTPPANPDMPEDIRRDYDEASAILAQSPRGAAAIIRLAVQKLCKELGQPGRNINQDIGALVKGGLDPRVQRSLDAVRVIGNDAVHPGQIDLRDDQTTAEVLFKLLNIIVEKTISEPNHINEIYESLPADKLRGIEDRDR
ncbi:MAG: DUF4145 domain-containing protein [Gemmobacter sp.]|nr:DUF4145 domain-containing protein [Gemmobacter sp.]